MDNAEFDRLYGPWDPLDPADAYEFLADFPGPWWVVGGWAVEAFSGVHREHHDLDVAIFKYDVPALLDLVADRFDVWSVSSGSLRPINETWPEPPPDAGQVWLREHAQAPWVIDLLINADRDGHSGVTSLRWSVRCDEVTWVADDGIRYQNPEVVLHHKALGNEERDRADRDAAWPLMDDAKRAWLREAVSGCTAPTTRGWPGWTGSPPRRDARDVSEPFPDCSTTLNADSMGRPQSVRAVRRNSRRMAASSFGRLCGTMCVVSISKYRHSGELWAWSAARTNAEAPTSVGGSSVALMYVRVKAKRSSGWRRRTGSVKQPMGCGVRRAVAQVPSAGSSNSRSGAGTSHSSPSSTGIRSMPMVRPATVSPSLGTNASR